jgi:hypothetical protein
MIDIHKLTCDSCNTTFDLEQDGGSLERMRHPKDGTLCNLEALCVECNTKLSGEQLRIDAAQLLLAGTGIQLLEN